MRPVLFWTHFVIGLAAGVFILLMSVTGALLTFEAQIERWARNAAIEAPEGAQPLSIEAAAAAARAAGAEAGATLTIPRDRGQAIDVGLGRRETLHLDPYTGAPLPAEAGARTESFFARVAAIHRWLSFGGGRSATGAAIMAAANAVFAAILATGIFLWLPRLWRWRILRNQLFFRRGLPNAQARDFNWHHVFGAWSLVPLAAIVLSGMLISYPALSGRLYAALGEPAGDGPNAPVPQRAGEAPSLDALAARVTEGAAGWNRLAITLPDDPAAPVVLALDRGNGRQLSRIETFRVSAAGVEALGAPPEQPRRFVRFLHTGEVFGLLGQTVAGLASIAAAVLVYTGLALGLRRLARMARTRRVAG